MSKKTEQGREREGEMSKFIHASDYLWGFKILCTASNFKEPNI